MVRGDVGHPAGVRLQKQPHKLNPPPCLSGTCEIKYVLVFSFTKRSHFLFLLHFPSWQEHLAALEAERATLAQQMERLVQENHDLLQAKMSLGLEVATYRYAGSFYFRTADLRGLEFL